MKWRGHRDYPAMRHGGRIRPADKAPGPTPWSIILICLLLLILFCLVIWWLVEGRKKISKKKKKIKKKKQNYQLNTKQAGEALELLTNLGNNSVNLVFFDPQYEKVANVLKLDYPLIPQSDYQILRILEQIERVIKPSAFCLLWVNKTLLGNDRIPLWLLKTPSLRIVDCLVWYKKNTLGLGSWLRNQAEFAFLLQKYPTNSKLFKNRSFSNVWTENSLAPSQRQHPHQKPRELLKSLILATTQEGDLIVDPCAGSFVVLDVCQELNRKFLGVDLTFKEMKKFKEKSIKT